MNPDNGESDLLYSLSNQTWTSQIDTGVAPFAEDLSSTIVLYVYIKSNTTTSGAVGSLYRIFTVMADDDTNRYCALGKQTRAGNALGFCFVTTTWSSLASRSCSAGNKKFVVTHEANSGNITLYNSMGSAINLSRTFTSSSRTLKLGGVADGTNALPASSIIRSCEIYNRVWSSDEISAFLA